MTDRSRDLLLQHLGTGAAKPLRSPFTEVWDKTVSGPQYLRGGRLTLDAAGVLPQDKGAAAGATNWTEEQAFANRLPGGDPRDYTLFQLAQAYGSRKASAEDEVVSQFDVNRLAVARAVCDERGEAGSYLFLKGGLSGIQRYLYDGIKAEQIGDAGKAAKLLRGRSALVSLLGDLTASYLVRELNLEAANVLFVGGGHFNILLPAGYEDKVAESFWRVNQFLLGDFDLKLHLVRGIVPVSATDLADFSPAFTAADARMEADKQRRYAGHLHERVVFQHRLQPALQSSSAAPEGEQESPRNAKARATALANFGGALARADFLLEISGEQHGQIADALRLKNGFSIGAIATGVYPLAEKDWQEIYDKLAVLATTDLNGHTVRLQRLNATDFLPPPALYDQFAASPLGYGFRLVGSTAPRYASATTTHAADEIMELTDLAGLGPEGKLGEMPYALLSALRLDVDDLGALFAHGLGSSTSLDRILGLSRETQLFFGGYFHRLAAEHQLYVIYSGGDDAFVLGSWINTLHFLRDLREDFDKFTVHNPAVGFSAGVFNCNPKYPIARLHADAAERESKAKKYGGTAKRSNVDALKNAVSVFDRVVSAERYAQLLKFAAKLEKSVRGDGRQKPINRSVLQTLLRVIASAETIRDNIKDKEEAKAAAEFEFYRNLGRLHGLLTRRGAIADPCVQEMLAETGDYGHFIDYLIPLNYVLHATRSAAN